MFKLKAASKSSVSVESNHPGEVPKEFDPEEAVGRMRARSESMRAWLDEDHGSEMDRGAHMEEGSGASAHWHAGYWSAMEDAVTLLTGNDAVSYAWVNAYDE
ncbi:MAG: hypothetical protein OXG71_09335 [Rhodospirillales bacterium]|nr:hypothetical protein [Rhodospirillales bacterium]